MSPPLAYGLIAQAILAAAAVRGLCELLARRGSRQPSGAPHARAPEAPRAPLRSDRQLSDVPRGAIWAMIAAPLVLLVPAGECSVAEHMRGIWGDPSIVTCAILALFVARPERLPPRPSRVVCAAITLLVTLPLYAPILGARWPLPNLYAWGWQPAGLLIATGAAALLLRLVRLWSGTWAAIVGIALLAYAARTMESTNLLDYLADPGLLLTLAAVAALPGPRKADATLRGADPHD